MKCQSLQKVKKWGRHYEHSLLTYGCLYTGNRAQYHGPWQLGWELINHMKDRSAGLQGRLEGNFIYYFWRKSEVWCEQVNLTKHLGKE